MQQPDRVARITYPTASFSLTAPQIAWLAAEAARRDLSKSALLRLLIDAAMKNAQVAA